MNYYSFNFNKDLNLFNNTNDSYFVSSDFKQFYNKDIDSWMFIRPNNVFDLYPTKLEIIQDKCYSGYVYEPINSNFEGEYFGVSYTPTNTILFVYKQFNTDILFQSIYPPIALFKTPSKSSILQLETDLTNSFIGIKLTNTDDINLLLT